MKVLECISHGTPFIATPAAMSGLPFMVGIPQIDLARVEQAAQLLVGLVQDPARLRALSRSISDQHRSSMPPKLGPGVAFSMVYLRPTGASRPHPRSHSDRNGHFTHHYLRLVLQGTVRSVRLRPPRSRACSRGTQNYQLRSVRPLCAARLLHARVDRVDSLVAMNLEATGSRILTAKPVSSIGGRKMTPNLTVLFISHEPSQCGVYQFGLHVAAALGTSKRYRFVYVECGSAAEYTAALTQYTPAAVIVNYLPITMPWLNWRVAGRWHGPTIGIVHEVTQELADAARTSCFVLCRARSDTGAEKPDSLQDRAGHPRLSERVSYAGHSHHR